MLEEEFLVSEQILNQTHLEVVGLAEKYLQPPAQKHHHAHGVPDVEQLHVLVAADSQCFAYRVVEQEDQEGYGGVAVHPKQHILVLHTQLFHISLIDNNGQQEDYEEKKLVLRVLLVPDLRVLQRRLVAHVFHEHVHAIECLVKLVVLQRLFLHPFPQSPPIKSLNLLLSQKLSLLRQIVARCAHLLLIRPVLPLNLLRARFLPLCPLRHRSAPLLLHHSDFSLPKINRSALVFASIVGSNDADGAPALHFIESSDALIRLNLVIRAKLLNRLV